MVERVVDGVDAPPRRACRGSASAGLKLLVEHLAGTAGDQRSCGRAGPAGPATAGASRTAVRSFCPSPRAQRAGEQRGPRDAVTLGMAASAARRRAGRSPPASGSYSTQCWRVRSSARSTATAALMPSSTTSSTGGPRGGPAGRRPGRAACSMVSRSRAGCRRRAQAASCSAKARSSCRRRSAARSWTALSAR